MRCSECRRIVRPVVVVDVDGTLAEYHQSVTDFAVRYWNLPEREDQWDGRGEMEDWLGITKEQWREMKMAYRAGGNKRSAKAYPGGAEFIQYAIELDCEVVIATSRPWMLLDSIDRDTRWWLETNFISYDHLVYEDNKYAALADLIDPKRVVMIVDDLEEMLEAAATYFGLGVEHKIARPHNARSTYPGFSFGELKGLLWNRVDMWRKEWQT